MDYRKTCQHDSCRRRERTTGCHAGFHRTVSGADAEEATKRMVTLMEPLLIMMMAVIVGFIMIAVMLPIYESYSAIENS